MFCLENHDCLWKVSLIKLDTVWLGKKISYLNLKFLHNFILNQVSVSEKQNTESLRITLSSPGALTLSAYCHGSGKNNNNTNYYYNLVLQGPPEAGRPTAEETKKTSINKQAELGACSAV